MRRRLQAKLGEHFELVLTIAGVIVALTLTIAGLELVRERQAFVFLVWLQGFILWAVRRHSLLSRRLLLTRLRVMLQDRVNNQLTVMLAMADLNHAPATPEDRGTIQRAVVAAHQVSEELAQLSLESLRGWEARYGDAAEPALSRRALL